MEGKTAPLSASTANSTASTGLDASDSKPLISFNADSGLNASSKPAESSSSHGSTSSGILAPTSTASSSSSSNAKPSYRPIRVKTSGASLWEKAVQKASAPPHEYRKLAIHFNSTIPEIFEHLCFYLDGLSIFGLYMTGDKRLQSRIATSVDDLRFHRNEGLFPFNVHIDKWPAFTKYFTKLRHFQLRYSRLEASASGLRKAAADLTTLPVTLNTLYLDCDLPDYSHLKDFVYLESLTLARVFKGHDRRDIVPLPAERLPPHLTYLDLSVFLTIPSLDDASLSTEEARKRLPGLQRLNYLSLRNETSIGASLLALLNPDIAEIHLPSHTRFGHSWIALLPKKVTALTLCFASSDGLLDWVSAFPSSLVDLRLIQDPPLPYTVINALPKTLTKIRFPASLDSHLELLPSDWFPTDLKTLAITKTAQGFAINDLPKGLKSLRLDGPLSNDLKLLPAGLTELLLPHAIATDPLLRILPKHLVTLKIPFSPTISVYSLSYLPKALTTLKLGGLLKNADVAHLPPGLTKLTLMDTTGLTAHCAMYLPRPLRVLRLLKNGQWEYTCVPHLPPHLEVLLFYSGWSGYMSVLPSLKQQYYSEQWKAQERRKKSLMSVAGTIVQ